MAKDHTKEAYEAKVLWGEKYVQLLKDAIASLEIKTTDTATSSFEKTLLKLQKHELGAKLKMNEVIAKDQRNHYQDIFLPEYEKRIEECYKNFDEYYDLIKKHIDKFPPASPLGLVIHGYPTENPDNKDEGRMLMFYERIKPIVLEIKKDF